MAKTEYPKVTAAEAIREVAERDHAKYPQYKGHWDGWRAAKFVKRVRNNRGSISFEPGDITIVSPDGANAYSWRTRNDMQVLPDEYVTAKI